MWDGPSDPSLLDPPLATAMQQSLSPLYIKRQSLSQCHISLTSTALCPGRRSQHFEAKPQLVTSLCDALSLGSTDMPAVD